MFVYGVQNSNVVCYGFANGTRLVIGAIFIVGCVFAIMFFTQKELLALDIEVFVVVIICILVVFLLVSSGYNEPFIPPLVMKYLEITQLKLQDYLPFVSLNIDLYSLSDILYYHFNKLVHMTPELIKFIKTYRVDINQVLAILKPNFPMYYEAFLTNNLSGLLLSQM